MAEPVIKGAGEGGMVDNPLTGTIVFKVRGEESEGSLTAFETVAPPGMGPPLHTHANEHESLYVLEGELRFKLGDELKSAPSGSFMFIPRGAPHTWQNVGDQPARILVHFTPSGMERFFEAFAAFDSPDPDGFARAGADAGMEVVGPPLAQSDPL